LKSYNFNVIKTSETIQKIFQFLHVLFAEAKCFDIIGWGVVGYIE